MALVIVLGVSSAADQIKTANVVARPSEAIQGGAFVTAWRPNWIDRLGVALAEASSILNIKAAARERADSWHHTQRDISHDY